MTFTEELKAFAREAGADLVGVASIGRFEGVNPQHHPGAIFPEARSVLVLGKRVVRGCLRGVEEGTQMGIYAQYAQNWVPDRFLAMTTVTVATFLEDHRWESVPLPNVPPEAPPMGVPVRPGGPAPNVLVDFDEAAVRAGLGRIGYSGEFMTPEYGPRQRLQMVLTDAPLDEDPLCETNPCHLCKECLAACPLGAMTEGGATSEICGLRMPMASVDWAVCRGCRNGATPNPRHPAGRPDRGAALCIRTCVHHLGGGFERPFRRRPAWRVDSAGRSNLMVED